MLSRLMALYCRPPVLTLLCILASVICLPGCGGPRSWGGTLEAFLQCFQHARQLIYIDRFRIPRGL